MRELSRSLIGTMVDELGWRGRKRIECESPLSLVKPRETIDSDIGRCSLGSLCS